MTQKKPITDKAILLYYDYEFLFEGLTDEELGETIRLLYKNNKIEEPQLNQSKNKQVNFVYNYIISRIIDYKKTKGFFSEAGKTGGNPALLGNTLKGGDKGGVNTGDILKEKKIKEKKIKEDIKKDIKKEKYGSFQNVLLTKEEFHKLQDLYSSKLNEAIEFLSTSIESKGYKYKSHYAVMNKSQWVYTKIMIEENKPSSTIINKLARI